MNRRLAQAACVALLPLLGATPPARWIVCIAPPLLPYAPALASAGVPLARLLVVRPERREDLLWAARQALLSGSCTCVLAWPQRIDNAGLRLLVRAGGSEPLKIAQVS